MCRRVAGVTLDNLDELPGECRGCVFWELSPQIQERAERRGHNELEKESWVSGVLLEWGSCGWLLRVDGTPAGFALYAPPAAVPRASTFPTGPVSADAALLTSLRVMPGFGGDGLGRALVQSVASDLAGRGVVAIEAFGDARENHRESEVESSCVIPAGFLLRVGFKTVRPDSCWPRLRLELRTSSSWKEDVEAALDRLLSEVVVSTNRQDSRSLRQEVDKSARSAWD